ncbi:hypothetical protein LCGC14_1768940 [marine sediment metagenome]|uniref:Uncharacterized protein n=1 Tax=marine sediment metagenome TaxID=412755 RepID=A0A0F9JYI2_9ZZZZ
MNVAIRIDTHFGVERRYFADERLQELYESATGRKVVTDKMIAYLEQMGTTITESEGT